MVNAIKFKRLKTLVLLTIVVGSCIIANAERATEQQELGHIAASGQQLNESEGKEVLTSFEERMKRKISLDFRNMPIDDVIALIAEQADVDIIKSPKVVGEVTAKLTDVPLDEALSNILTAHGYDYVATGNMIRIVPIEDITLIPEKFVSRIYRITYADVKEVTKALKQFISSSGSLSSNPGTSNIIVTDLESKIQAIDTFIVEIDRITPQILVEVRIYDITVQDTLDIGVQWQAGRDTDYGASGITDLGTNPGRDRNPFLTGLFEGATDNTDTTSGALRLGWLNAGIDIDVLLRAEQENRNAKLLANPRILVLDNETATFEIIREIPYEESSDTSAGGSLTSTEFKEIGVKLEVTPHVTRDDMLRLHIIPEFGVLVSLDPTSGIPTVDTRRLDTIALVKNNQTVVLGGLRKKDVSKQTNKIPFLGDLPLIGGLFRFEGENTTVTELVVFITPRIIEQPVLSESEKQAYEVTEFSGPKPIATKAEKKSRK